MGSVIDWLFDCEIAEHNIASKPTDLSKDKEFIAYEKLKKTLSVEQQDLLDRFLEAQVVGEEEKLKLVYNRGFKIGLLIGLETAGFDPEC